jgi:hypothetical protein
MQAEKDYWKYRLSDNCSCWSIGSQRLPISFGTHKSPYGRLARTGVTLERLRKRGYESMLAHYQTISPQLNEPLYTRTVQPVPFFSGYSGVRGALRLGHQTEPSTRLN